MLRSLVVRRWQHGQTQYCHQLYLKRALTTGVQQQDEPLRILFCGSETFSIVALEALREYQISADSNILSIDVATRKDKTGGRGMKEIRSPQIKRAAARLGLRVHQFDTFTGWHLPEYGDSSQPYINLVVAVSFGLLVPPRILNSARFGGLNVHPSMLPDLRGAAPINWAIIKGHTQTGVTLQTLHPSRFDHGAILDQTPQPGLAIPNPDKITAHDLRLLLAPIGADMLVNAIRNKLYLRPYQEVVSQHSTDQMPKFQLAPKVTTSMKVLNPYGEEMSHILRKNRAIPKLWAEVRVAKEEGEQIKRIIFGTNMRAASKEDPLGPEVRDLVDEIPAGVPFALLPPGSDVNQCQNPVYLKVKGDSIMVLPDMLVAGGREGPSAAVAAHAKLFAEPYVRGSTECYRFRQPLVMPKADA